VPQWDNPIAGILHHDMDVSFNFVLKDGVKTEYPCSDLELSETRLKDPTKVKRVKIREFNESWHPEMYGKLERKSPTAFQTKQFRSIVALHGIEFFDSDNNLLLRAGFFGNQKAYTREFTLDEDERLIGVFSRIEERY
jgi:hypothetical protein